MRQPTLSTIALLTVFLYPSSTLAVIEPYLPEGNPDVLDQLAVEPEALSQDGPPSDDANGVGPLEYQDMLAEQGESEVSMDVKTVFGYFLSHVEMMSRMFA